MFLSGEKPTIFGKCPVKTGSAAQHKMKSCIMTQNIRSNVPIWSDLKRRFDLQ
jgi:hypothetical protein